jgi:hypothetical protein
MVLALQIVDLMGDTDLGGAEKPTPIMVDLIEESPVKAASERPHRKGPIEPKAPSAGEGGTRSWGEAPVI